MKITNKTNETTFVILYRCGEVEMRRRGGRYVRSVKRSVKKSDETAFAIYMYKGLGELLKKVKRTYGQIFQCALCMLKNKQK